MYLIKFSVLYNNIFSGIFPSAILILLNSRVVTRFQMVFPVSMLLLVESHIQSYGISNNISYIWNLGFVLGVLFITQLVSGILITAHYNSDTRYAQSSIQYINKDISSGWFLHYIHSNTVSVIFFGTYIHISRGLYISSYKLMPTLWISGIVILALFITTAFVVYVLTWGQISFWGVTVIKNILSSIPCLVECLCGCFYVCNPTLIRFCILHLLLPLVISMVIVLHLAYCHYISSSNPLGMSLLNYSSTTISFYPSVFHKDVVFHILVYGMYTFQLSLLIILVSHPDSSVDVNELVTPMHIVPEWYLLCYYMVLKGIPNVNTGFLLMILCLLILFQLTELKNTSRISRLTSYMSLNINTALMLLLVLVLLDTCFGSQLPHDTYLSAGRVFLGYKTALLVSSIHTSTSSPTGTHVLSCGILVYDMCRHQITP